MGDAFQVTRPLTGRAATATSARATLTTVAVRIVALTGRTATATAARAALTVLAGVPPPGAYASARLNVAAALADLDPDWEVHAGIVDSVTPPAFLIVWANPWSTPSTACYELAALEVVCVAYRIDVDPGVETLELMVAAALGALADAGIPHGSTSAPRPFEIAGVPYLAARIQVTQTVNVGSN